MSWARIILLATLVVTMTQCSRRTGADGSDGTSGETLVKVVSLPPGDPACAAGGTLLETTDGGSLACNGTPGEPGRQGDRGPQGDPGQQGPQGTPGQNASRAGEEISWADELSLPCCRPATLPGSRFTANTSAGALLIFVDVGLSGRGLPFGCAPFIDERWAGAYGGLPSGESFFSMEGFENYAIGTFRWQKTRLYPRIPAGRHVFELRCLVADDLAPVQVCNLDAGPCNWGFIEI